jgi:hypothetical protein
MVEFYFSDKFTTIMNAVYDYVKLADEKVREVYEQISQEDEEPSPSWMPDELREALEEGHTDIRDFYESNDEDSLFSMPQDISESRFGIGLLLEKERYNFNLKQLFKSNDTLPLIGTWLGINEELDLSVIYKEFQVELITLYVCRVFFNDDTPLQSSEIDNLNPNRWDNWNRKFGLKYIDVISLLDKKYTELKNLIDWSATNNIITWEEGSEFHGIYSRIKGSGGGDSGRRAFSYIPLWLLLNNVASVYSDSQSPKFEMMSSNLTKKLTQSFEINLEYLITQRSLKRSILNRVSNLEGEDGLPFRGKGEGLSPYALISQIDVDWFRNNGVDVKAKQEYRLDISFGDGKDWLYPQQFGGGRRGVDSAYLRIITKYEIKIDGVVKDKWTTDNDTWSFGLTGQFSINQPNTPNKLYQSLQYKITGLISDYLILKPINYPKGIYIKLPPQEE